MLYALSFLLALVLLAADQWSKFWVNVHLSLGETAPLLPPILELHAVHNYGAAWSIFSGARWLLVAVTCVMVAATAAVLFLRLVKHPMGVVAAFLILSGGVGNLMDRLFLGYVVDMIRFQFWPSYPTFNVADICVVTGCLLWLTYVLFIREELPDAEEAEEAPDTTEEDAAAAAAREAALKAEEGRRQKEASKYIGTLTFYGDDADGKNPKP